MLHTLYKFYTTIKYYVASHVYSMQDQFAALHENPDLYVFSSFAVLRNSAAQSFYF